MATPAQKLNPNTRTAMPRIPATRQSAKNVLNDIKATRKALNAAWSTSRKCLMYQKKPKTSATGKKQVTRTARLIHTHALKILASGAALNAAAATRHEAGVLRVGISGENRRAPMLPAVSAGAQHALESYLNAFAATALQKACAIRDGLGVGKRVSPRMMQMAFEVVNEQVHGAAPGGTIVMGTPMKKRRKAKAKASPSEAGKEAEAAKAKEPEPEAASADA